MNMAKPKLFILSIMGAFFLLPASAVAQFNPLEEACNESTNTASGSSTCVEAEQQGSTNPITGPGGVIATVGRVISIIVGVAAIIMLIIGGFSFVTAGGSTDTLAKARKRVIYSIVGLVVAALSWTIISLVTDRLL